MKLLKTVSVISAAILFVAPMTGISAFAQTEPIEVTSIFEQFNPNDVNGDVTLNIPDNTSVTVKIKAKTPEGDYDYYSGTYSSSQSNDFIFPIEGYDDRTYSVEFMVKDEVLDAVSDAYSEDISIPEGDKTLSTKTVYTYVISVDDKDSEVPYDVSKEETVVDDVKYISRSVKFYVKSYVLGDVNDDGSINAVDASLVLTEYATTSTGAAGSFSANQKKAADVNKNGSVDAVDASKILSYYADESTGKTPSWD